LEKEARKIAILTAELSDAYQAAVWNGIAGEASRHNLDVTCFLGSRMDSPVPQESASNTVYDLADGRNFDGLIIVSSAISTYLNTSRVQALFDSRMDIPRVSIGIPVRGASSVTVDSHDAMVEVTEHLIDVHGRRAFAIVAGPQWHLESEQRKTAILECLSRRNIAWNEELIVHGSFEQESGSRAICTLLETGRPIDAVLCLNDRMALGALRELQRNGIAVGQEVSLVGFDGIEETMYRTPPLTTVLQPLPQLGARAVKELCSLMEGKKPQDTQLHCEPLYRESCGCPVHSHPQQPSGHVSNKDIPEAFRDTAGELLALAKNHRRDAFLTRWNQALSSSVLGGGRLDDWARVLASIRGRLISERQEIDTGATLAWVKLLDDAGALLAEMKCRVQASRRLEQLTHTGMLRAVGISLMEAFETPELLRRLRAGLSRMGFSEAFLVLFDDKKQTDGSSRLLLGMQDGKIAPDKGNARHFPRSRVLPADVLEKLPRGVWLLVPVVFQTRALGYLILPGDFPDPGVYETISKQLASSLQGALLLEQVRGHEQILEQEVQRRTEELMVANRSLRSEIKTRGRLEQEVVEISRQTMERIGQDLHDDLCQHLAGVAMHVSALINMLDGESEKARSAASRINGLLGESIERTKAIVRGLFPVSLREEGLLVALAALADATERSSGIRVRFQGDRRFLTLAPERALELYRIIQEALNNSVKHSGATQIEVTLRAGPPFTADGEPQLLAEIIDNGKGLSARQSSTGMGLKIMRYRAEKARADLEIAPTNPGTMVRCALRPAYEGV